MFGEAICCVMFNKNSLIIQDENTKENHKHVVSLYKIKPRLSLVHTSNISIRTRSIRKQRMIYIYIYIYIYTYIYIFGDLRRQNKKNISLFRLLFGSWLMLGL